MSCVRIPRDDGRLYNQHAILVEPHHLIRQADLNVSVSDIICICAVRFPRKDRCNRCFLLAADCLEDLLVNSFLIEQPAVISDAFFQRHLRADACEELALALIGIVLLRKTGHIPSDLLFIQCVRAAFFGKESRDHLRVDHFRAVSESQKNLRAENLVHCHRL